MDELSLLQRVAVWVLPVLFAITVHETAHGWMALRLGDPTAKMLGRLTLTPIKHIDPLGTILVPGLMLLFSGFLFGWAKPVPITAQNLRNPKADMAWVALAGPLSNLLMAVFWALVARLGVMIGGAGGELSLFLIYSGVAGIFVNTLLMVLNLLPIPPLDGGRVLSALLPGRLSWQLDRLEPFGFFILLALLFTGVLGMILWPIIGLVLTGLAPVGGFSIETLSYLLYTLRN